MGRGESFGARLRLARACVCRSSRSSSARRTRAPAWHSRAVALPRREIVWRTPRGKTMAAALSGARATRRAACGRRQRRRSVPGPGRRAASCRDGRQPPSLGSSRRAARAAADADASRAAASRAARAPRDDAVRACAGLLRRRRGRLRWARCARPRRRRRRRGASCKSSPRPSARARRAARAARARVPPKAADATPSRGGSATTSARVVANLPASILAELIHSPSSTHSRGRTRGARWHQPAARRRADAREEGLHATFSTRRPTAARIDASRGLPAGNTAGRGSCPRHVRVPRDSIGVLALILTRASNRGCRMGRYRDDVARGLWSRRRYATSHSSSVFPHRD